MAKKASRRRYAKRSGRATFHRANEGQFKTVTTSPASTIVIEKAMVTYRRALRRLADR